jgi:hypothetical protein
MRRESVQRSKAPTPPTQDFGANNRRYCYSKWMARGPAWSDSLESRIPKYLIFAAVIPSIGTANFLSSAIYQNEIADAMFCT